MRYRPVLYVSSLVALSFGFWELAVGLILVAGALELNDID